MAIGGREAREGFEEFTQVIKVFFRVGGWRVSGDQDSLVTWKSLRLTYKGT